MCTYVKETGLMDLSVTEEMMLRGEEKAKNVLMKHSRSKVKKHSGSMFLSQRDSKWLSSKLIIWKLLAWVPLLLLLWKWN